MLTRSLHVGLNLLFVVPGDTGGTEVYARELIGELRDLSPQLRLTGFLGREAAQDRDQDWRGLMETRVLPVRCASRVARTAAEQTLLPGAAARAGVDLLHSLANTAPVAGPFRRVVTIHDLNYRIVPAAHLGVMGLGMGMLVPLAARSAHRIIVPAQATAQDLVRLLGARREKIDVIPEGLGGLRRVEPLAAVSVREHLGAGSRPIVLSVSAMRPHKNLLRLLGAIALIPTERRPVLVLAGYSTSHEAELRGRIDQLGLWDDVRILGWVDAPLLEGLYAAAAAFVFPSLYEGFGLPVLEAMARGLPVACSARGSLAEVAGGAALEFDPTSEPDIASAVERLLADESEACRLRELGRANAARFSWRRAADATLNVYERTVGVSR